MSARKSDLLRVRELHAVIQETQERVREFGVEKADFLANDTIRNRSIADSLLMCVFRATEEVSAITQETRDRHPEVAWGGIHKMRNILAHDYGSVDREIVWNSIEHDFPELDEFCKRYCRNAGAELEG